MMEVLRYYLDRLRGRPDLHELDRQLEDVADRIDRLDKRVRFLQRRIDLLKTRRERFVGNHAHD